MCTVVPISLTVGANRIVPTVAIPHPLGQPGTKSGKKMKRNCAGNWCVKHLRALQTEVDGQTVFSD
jgi:betaine reductase